MRTLFAAFLILTMLPSLAFAMSLSEAKAQGFVGEQPDGYLGVVKPGAEDVVASTNAARKAEYEKIAAQNKQDRSVVEKLAAKQAYEKTLSGNYVQGADGIWQKK